MSFGDAWESFLGSCDRKTTFDLVNYFYKEGGNFIDSSSNYQDEQSETWIGELMAERKCRDEMDIATMFTTPYKKIIQANFGGNNSKALRHSLDASLKKLRTEFIDILYVHWWDYTTSIPELMHSLDDVVKSASEAQLKMSEVLEGIAGKKGNSITGIALSYVMHKTFYVFPICGGRKVEHLQANIEAFGVELNQEDMDEIEDAVPFDLGFPYNFAVNRKQRREIKVTDLWANEMIVQFDIVERPGPIRGGQHKE